MILKIVVVNMAHGVIITVLKVKTAVLCNTIVTSYPVLSCPFLNCYYMSFPWVATIDHMQGLTTVIIILINVWTFPLSLNVVLKVEGFSL